MSQINDVNPAISQLGDCLSQAAETQRQLFQEMASFARDESLRFAKVFAWSAMARCWTKSRPVAACPA